LVRDIGVRHGGFGIDVAAVLNPGN
jgi:hypothetical protein